MTTDHLQQMAAVCMSVMINTDKVVWDKIAFDIDENDWDYFLNECAEIYKNKKAQFKRQKIFFDNLASNFKF